MIYSKNQKMTTYSIEDIVHSECVEYDCKCSLYISGRTSYNCENCKHGLNSHVHLKGEVPKKKKKPLQVDVKDIEALEAEVNNAITLMNDANKFLQ